MVWQVIDPKTAKPSGDLVYTGKDAENKPQA